MIYVAKTLLLPGTLSFAIVVAGAGALLALRAGAMRRAGRAILVILVAAYYVAALPWVAARVSARLMGFEAIRDSREARHANAIVVLSGDSEDARIVEALRLHALLQPRWIVVSGPGSMRHDLIQGGIAPEGILMESSGHTTRQQALNVEALLRSRGIGRVVLVASAIHMPRALAMFRAVGVDAIPSASATRPIADFPQFLPALNALRLSRESLYEYAALAYYRRQGWAAPSC